MSSGKWARFWTTSNRGQKVFAGTCRWGCLDNVFRGNRCYGLSTASMPLLMKKSEFDGTYGRTSSDEIHSCARAPLSQHPDRQTSLLFRINRS